MPDEVIICSRCMQPIMNKSYHFNTYNICDKCAKSNLSSVSMSDVSCDLAISYYEASQILAFIIHKIFCNDCAKLAEAFYNVD